MGEKIGKAARWWELEELPAFGDEQTLTNAVYFALLAGETQPLAAFLRRGYALDDRLRHQIANMLSGCAEEWILEAKKQAGDKGPGSGFTQMLTAARNDEIGEFVAARRAKHGKLESALADAVVRFGTGGDDRAEADRSLVRRAWQEWKKAKGK